jgi:hypothetical protein
MDDAEAEEEETAVPMAKSKPDAAVEDGEEEESDAEEDEIWKVS